LNFATNLEEKQYKLVSQYVGLLDIIEEALKYVVASFTDLSKTEGDMLLSEVFLTVEQISECNPLLIEIFNGSEGIQRALIQFETVTDPVWRLDGQLESNIDKQSIVQEILSPAFSTWKMTIEKELNPYLTH
jgi:hypothetical protein